MGEAAATVAVISLHLAWFLRLRLLLLLLLRKGLLLPVVAIRLKNVPYESAPVFAPKNTGSLLFLSTLLVRLRVPFDRTFGIHAR